MFSEYSSDDAVAISKSGDITPIIDDDDSMLGGQTEPHQLSSEIELTTGMRSVQPTVIISSSTTEQVITHTPTQNLPPFLKRGAVWVYYLISWVSITPPHGVGVFI